MKHIDIKVQMTREKIVDGSISVQYVPTSMNCADGLTKSLKNTPFKKFVADLGMMDRGDCNT